MSYGVSILLIAIGAVLTWGVSRSVSGIELNTIGVILMIVGGLGFLASLIFSSSMPWRRDAAPAPDDAVVERDEFGVRSLR